MAKTFAGGFPIDKYPDFNLEFQRKLCVPWMTDAEWESAVAADTGDPLIKLINARKCPAYTIQSIGIAGRCVPDFGLIQDKTDNSTSMTDANGNDIENGEEGIVDVGDVLESIKSIVNILNLQQFAEKFLSDLVKTWPMLLAGVGISKIKDTRSPFPLFTSYFRSCHLLLLDLLDEVHCRGDDLAFSRAHHCPPSSQFCLHLDEIRRLEGGARCRRIHMERQPNDSGDLVFLSRSSEFSELSSPLLRI